MPWSSTAVIFAPDLSGSCSTVLDSWDIDFNTKIYMGGRTASASSVYNDATLSCHNADNMAGYVTLMTSGTATWSKYFIGSYTFTNDNLVLRVPWVGLSRSAQAHTREVYTDYVAAYIQMTSFDYLIWMAGADGTLINMQ